MIDFEPVLWILAITFAVCLIIIIIAKLFPNEKDKRTHIANAQGKVNDPLLEYLEKNPEQVDKKVMTDSVIKQKLIDYYAKEKVKHMEEDDCLDTIIDPLMEEAIQLIVSTKIASTSCIQRGFSIGYNRAGRIIDQLEEIGIVSEFRGSEPRKILINDLEKIDLKKSVLCQLLNVESLDLFFKENENEILERAEYYDFLMQKEKEEKERAIIEREKEAIKQAIIEKKRRREIREAALEELRKEGIVENIQKREPIPQEIQDIVWNRDGGKCVKCGSNEKLEFDHIIPLSKGGANTARNLQLLCEKCNRKKSNKIG